MYQNVEILRRAVYGIKYKNCSQNKKKHMQREEESKGESKE